MIPVSQLCKRRKINSADLLTPMLIPSFSSKGFPEIRWVWKNVRDHLTDTALVSSYDVYYDALDSELEAPNLLFVDSGGYEARIDYDLSEIYKLEHKPQDWDREKHKSALNKIKTFSSLVLVSYDELNNQNDISSQVRIAKNFFSEHSEVATDFLIKPHNSEFIDIEELETSIHLLADFDLIGVTEKELGNCLATRLHNVAKLRTRLSNIGLETPIHIFGCLDPISVWLFYLCGADVFDGLSWLRFAFYENVPIYRNSWAVLTEQFAVPDHELALVSWIENIETLNKQRVQMARFLDEYNVETLPMKIENLKAVLNKVGIFLTERDS